jgi:hypothetical protein
MEEFKKYSDFLLESAPRLPNDENYWLKKGKSGKNVCLITHDDMDGVVSAIIMKKYLLSQGFEIKKYGIINYQEGWQAFRIDSKLITIALDFAEDIPGVDLYVDHHGKFDEETRKSQKRFSVKTATGSAAEGIALQLGVPFSNDTKDWIDMIDSAKYSEYEVDIKGILEFDFSLIKDSPRAKLKFAAAFNQLLKRSDHKTFIEVINSSKDVSIYNIFRLFKIFYPKNNPDWKSGIEPEFVQSGRERIKEMQKKTRGTKGYNPDGTKKIYNTQDEFWQEFARKVSEDDVDSGGGAVSVEKWKLDPSGYQIIGNLMFVSSGTWSNALRAKAIYSQDIEDGILPDDPKRNFVLLQYGNTLQVADLNTKIKKMNPEDLPVDIAGNKISNLGHYCENLVKNFEKHLDYQDERTVSGGHDGIGSISNIFGKCKKGNFLDSKFLDMFKNKIINDLSGVKWNIKMPWNEQDAKPIKVRPEEINKKLLDVSDVRTEEDVRLENTELEMLNFIVKNSDTSVDYMDKFKNSTTKKLYKVWLDTKFDEAVKGVVKISDLPGLYFKKNRNIEKTRLFSSIVSNFNLDEIYSLDDIQIKKDQRKTLKMIFVIIFNMLDDKFLNKDTESKFNRW